MTWAVLIDLLVKFLPLIVDWLRKLLREVEAEMAAVCPDDCALAIHDVFARARGRLYVWQFARRRALAACERAALARAGEFAAAARGQGPPPAMTGREYDAVVGA